jgi:hypothetical protein
MVTEIDIDDTHERGWDINDLLTVLLTRLILIEDELVVLEVKIVLIRGCILRKLLDDIHIKVVLVATRLDESVECEDKVGERAVILLRSDVLEDSQVTTLGLKRAQEVLDVLPFNPVLSLLLALDTRAIAFSLLLTGFVHTSSVILIGFLIAGLGLVVRQYRNDCNILRALCRGSVFINALLYFFCVLQEGEVLEWLRAIELEESLEILSGG